MGSPMTNIAMTAKTTNSTGPTPNTPNTIMIAFGNGNSLNSAGWHWARRRHRRLDNDKQSRFAEDHQPLAEASGGRMSNQIL
jgi:hypothetical protein